jgi:hypothetical protein
MRDVYDLRVSAPRRLGNEFVKSCNDREGNRRVEGWIH